MKSFLHYIQHDQMDCGPTCLRMVAAHYGKRLDFGGEGGCTVKAQKRSPRLLSFTRFALSLSSGRRRTEQ